MRNLGKNCQIKYWLLHLNTKPGDSFIATVIQLNKPEGESITSTDECQQEELREHSTNARSRLLIWLFAPGMPYLLNKFAIAYRDSFLSPTTATTVFAVCVPIWIVFGIVWCTWILRSTETRFMKACTTVPLLAVFSAAIFLNYKAATQTLGLIHFP